MNSRDLHSEMTRKLIDANYLKREAETISMMLIEYFYDISRIEVLTNKTIDNTGLHDSAFKLVLDGHPIQYVLGEAHFYGLIFKVDTSVLIPRQETEELVSLIIKENTTQAPNILDIGTGSGCIAISLAKHLKGSKVFGYDISEVALNIASHNAWLNRTQVDFQKVDILESQISLGKVDVIVSNPPYVRKSEKRQMESRVLDFEPALALYVEDSDPLVFYKRISQLAAKVLSSNGRLYFEINEAFPEEVHDCMENEGFDKISIFKDLNDRPRIVRGILP